ncbi:heavy metal-(Cd/Co/Hg/Pb/Zn)-translocating P-type ATPase [Brevibacterium siliguriense]|uniref:Heavy metal-(Cd/Co/Hg/Pb/Zn)-translocating P-type ATPase n=1 Tax=Brevibacterium siliguriense TaxID=1136497 RepID=A0A1H1MKU7_9MICO|nr:cation-translocating P-type ATPase [Brevibacterium siliguriense]SDR87403.1 heavy metal-(Cd/Co/Hg/Pb/Zn)-translocating P-type ATPase [Brevibacterium siliguriense]
MSTHSRASTPTDSPAPGMELLSRIDRGDLARTLAVAACAVAVALGVTGPWPAVPVIAVVGIVLGCWPIAVEAVEDVIHRRMSMEASMLIAIVAAAAIGEWTTALVITAFVLAAEILEDLSMDRGRDALTDLMSFLPEIVQVRRSGSVLAVPLAEVVVGDTVVIVPGERVPVDGRILLGTSSLDQSRITGEPLPVDVTTGDEVFAGSVNQVGALDVRAERVGAESSIGRIISAVEEAQSSEPPAQRLADRLAAWLVGFALIGAVVTYLFTRDLTATISVVVVAGACGIAAGTPLAVLAAIARIARSGAFVKDGAHLEALSSIDTVVFDKTGTLTTGAPAVVSISVPDSDAILRFDVETVLSLAATAESYSEHPLGKAIVAHALDHGLTPASAEDFAYRPGHGVTAIVDGHTVSVGSTRLVPDAPTGASADDPTTTEIHVSVDGAYAGTIFIADAIRESAVDAVAQLSRMGLRTMMITGDRPETARAVAAHIGIDDVRAGLLPEEKLAAVDAERTAGRSITMVGDGVNDAPALARADVGIAMGSGTDLARESADVVLISSDLSDLVHTVSVARRARRIVMVNFVGTIAIDLIGMGLAAFGLLSPVAAAFIHVGSETAFILNSARLIPGRASGRRR